MSKIWTVEDDFDTLFLDSNVVEEIEGKGSPSENPDSPNDSSQDQGGHSRGDGGRGRGHHHHHHHHHDESSRNTSVSSDPPDRHSDSTSKTHDSSRSPSESPANRSGSKSNQRWMKLRTTVQLSGAISSSIQKKAPLKREDSFLKRFSTRQIPEAQETFEIGEDDGTGVNGATKIKKRRRTLPRSVVNPDGNFYFYWLMLLTFCVLYNLWTLIVRQSFPELQADIRIFWIVADAFSDLVFILDIAVQFRTGYLEQGLMVYKTKKLSKHYLRSRPFCFDIISLIPTDILQFYLGTNPMLRFPRFLKVYRIYNYYYMVESRTVYPNVWRVVNLIHILLLLAHWFGCFYFLLSEAESFIGPWVYPDPEKNGNFSSLTRKYLGSLYWSTLTLTTIGDLPTPYSNWQYLFTIVSYLIGVFIFATIVGQVGNVITNRNANRLEFERLLDGAKMYMRHHKVPRDMQRRVLRWYDYSWSRGRIQGGGDINTALGLLPDKLKTELALHVNLSVLKKVTIFQECQPEFLHDLVLKMKAYIFTPGDLICRKGEVAREMFIIADGILEVISDLGKVLTTMQAGDFFGEIGILNLDGLNKRTADVRSVGYSELFSLSREDVLAAMKDYPEAQEILKTLGRKRLMEARKASAPVQSKKNAGTDLKKAVPAITAPPPSLAQSHTSLTRVVDTPETDNASRRIVEKLRSDVRGLRNAIRRSRKSNSSKEDSSEPESGKDRLDSAGASSGRRESVASVADGRSSLSSTRGVLKRMHHVVLSDERDKDRDPSTTSTSPSSPAILSKRVQLPMDEESGGGGGEPEVIGAGLPLMQRLRLLKKKEEKQARAAAALPPPHSMSTGTAGAASSSLVGTIVAKPTEGGSMLHTRVFMEPPPKMEKIVMTESAPPPPPPTTVTAPSVLPSTPGRKRLTSSSDKLGSSESPSPAPTTATQSFVLPCTSSTSSGTEVAGVTGSAGAGIEMGPGTSYSTLPTSGDNFVHSGETGGYSSTTSSESNSLASRSGGLSSERPSILHFRNKNKKTYGSVDDLSPEFSRLPFVKKLQILNERQKIAQLIQSKPSNIVLTRSTSEGSRDVPTPGTYDSAMHSVLMGRRTQSSSERYSTTDIIAIPTLPPDHPLFFLPPLTPSNDDENEPDDSSAKESVKDKPEMRSIPASSSAAPPTSTSASVGPNSSSLTSANTSVPLPSTECTGGSAATIIATTTTTTSLTVTTTSAEGEEGREKEVGGSLPPRGRTPSPPLSPESNETPERRNLKSILKRLAEQSAQCVASWEDESGQGGSRPSGPSSTHTSSNRGLSTVDYQLLKAPTLEGYAARHRKFSKNVTFQRQAVAVISPDGPEAAPIPSTHHQPTEETAALETALAAFAVSDQETTENVATKITASLTLMKEREILELAALGIGMGMGVSQEECIGTLFLGIRGIIQSRVEEIQARLQTRYITLQEDVRQRDHVIAELQHRIVELELLCRTRELQEPTRAFSTVTALRTNHVSTVRNNNGGYHQSQIRTQIGGAEVSTSGSQFGSDIYELPLVQSYLFSRGDSIDTVISNQDFDDEVFDMEQQDDDGDTVGPLSPRQMSQMLQQQQEMSDPAGQQPSYGQGAIRTQAARKETIEMKEMAGPLRPLWELEFHRESLPPEPIPPVIKNLNTGSVAVNIENTSTEDNSSTGSSTSSDDEPTRKLVRSATVIQAPGKGTLVEERNSSEEEEDDEEGESSSSSDEDTQFTNQNWEVQMLAKEMQRIEEQKQTELYTKDVRKSELQELENEIREIKEAVSEGVLSPTELDMLEQVLETKTRRIKGLAKAYSVETSGPTSSHRLMSTKSKVRSIDDFRQRSTHGYPGGGQNPCMKESSSKSSKPLSPGERRDLQKLIFYRKSGGVKRQASLCEGPAVRRRDSVTSTASSTTSSATTSFSSSYPDQYNRNKRRESADSLVKLPSESKSFFSRLSFVRQLSRSLHSSKSIDEPHHIPHPSMTMTSSSQMSSVTTSAIPIQAPIYSSMTSMSPPSRSVEIREIPGTSKGPSTGTDRDKTNSSSLSHKSSSVGILPLISSTITSALSSSVKSDPGTSSHQTHHHHHHHQRQQPHAETSSTSPPRIFTIPSASIPSPQSEHQKYIGESQPLLKK